MCLMESGKNYSSFKKLDLSIGESIYTPILMWYFRTIFCIYAHEKDLNNFKHATIIYKHLLLGISRIHDEFPRMWVKKSQIFVLLTYRGLKDSFQFDAVGCGRVGTLYGDVNFFTLIFYRSFFLLNCRPTQVFRLKVKLISSQKLAYQCNKILVTTLEKLYKLN